ncbi:MAG: FAD-linked oxidase [Sandaracinus sp.]|nr:FAD-linked oxidase [Sandaracinus sp.]
MTETLAGWGNYPRAECEVAHPESAKGVRRAVSSAGTIARGLGRSYGDPALNEHGRVIAMEGLDGYLGFDEATGTLRCEAGTTLEQIIADFAPRGFFPMVTPGTKFVTVGGCIANDVHGKAHHADGCFSSCVDSFRKLLASGEVVECSREANADLFWGTFGGMGLLGVVLDATIRLRPIETTFFHQKAITARNLDELLDAIEEHDEIYPYSVAWLDSLATGDALGRGVLTVGDHAKLADLSPARRRDPLRVSAPSPLVVPFDLPSFTLSTFTIRILNLVLDQVQSHGASVAHYEKFFYPLDFVGEWNRGYGKRGFTQYQFVIPLEGGRDRMRTILSRIAASGCAPFLNVLKRFGEANEAPLSFPFRGWTFAIDFPIGDGLAPLLADLDAIVLEAGGRLYLGKDAFLDAPTFRRMYPRLDEWLALKGRVDPDGVFTSNLARRLELV